MIEVVAIKDFKMPKNCNECPLVDDDWIDDYYTHCSITGHPTLYSEDDDSDRAEVGYHRRHPLCPLIKVKY